MLPVTGTTARRLMAGGVLSCLSSWATTAHAEMLLVPRASLSLAAYEFSQSSRPGALSPSGINNNDFPPVEFAVTFKMLGVGASLLNDGFYADIGVSQSLKESDDFTLQDPALPGGRFQETFEGDRQDISLTFGKKLLDNRAAVYGGYKIGKSEAQGNQGQHLTFEESGPFIGTNYNWPIADKGVLAVNLAWASLSGKLKEDVSNPAFASLPIPLDIDADSDATGLSYGLSWSARLGDNSSYSLALDARNYTFENVTDSNPQTIGSKQFDEEFLSTSFSVFWVF